MHAMRHMPFCRISGSLAWLDLLTIFERSPGVNPGAGTSAGATAGRRPPLRPRFVPNRALGGGLPRLVSLPPTSRRRGSPWRPHRRARGRLCEQGRFCIQEDRFQVGDMATHGGLPVDSLGHNPHRTDEASVGKEQVRTFLWQRGKPTTGSRLDTSNALSSWWRQVFPVSHPGAVMFGKILLDDLPGETFPGALIQLGEEGILPVREPQCAGHPRSRTTASSSQR